MSEQQMAPATVTDLLRLADLMAQRFAEYLHGPGTVEAYVVARQQLRDALVSGVMPCPTCEGRGEVATVEYADSMNGFLSAEPCKDCNGTGYANATAPASKAEGANHG